MSKKYYATLAVATALLLLTVIPVHAAPPLSMGSTATYNLTGKLQAKESCTANPITYASQVCTGTRPVSNSTPPPPSPTSFQVDLTGSVGWNVEGLNSSEADLLVSHNVGVSVSPIPFIRITPVTESGSFEQTVNLSTRVESPGTNAGIVTSLFTSSLQALPGASLANAVSGAILRSLLGTGSSGPDYTQWWVNGPLTNGSLVRILHRLSSVTGSENLDLGGSIGARSGWIVTSQVSQTFSVTIPEPNNLFGPWPVSTAGASLKMLWSFDENSDLLLRTNDTFALMIHSVMPMPINNAATFCVPPQGVTYCVSTPVIVSVTRDITVNVSVALRLSSTNLTLRPPGTGSQPSTPTGLLAAMPWIPLGIAGIAAGVGIGLILWFTRRTKRTPLVGPTQFTTPSAPSTTS